jgi:hypothetical protein
MASEPETGPDRGRQHASSHGVASGSRHNPNFVRAGRGPSWGGLRHQLRATRRQCHSSDGARLDEDVERQRMRELLLTALKSLS